MTDTGVTVGVVEVSAIGAALEWVVERLTTYVGNHHIHVRAISSHHGNLTVAESVVFVVHIVVLLTAVEDVNIVLFSTCIGLFGCKHELSRHVTRVHTHIEWEVLGALRELAHIHQLVSLDVATEFSVVDGWAWVRSTHLHIHIRVFQATVFAVHVEPSLQFNLL